MQNQLPNVGALITQLLSGPAVVPTPESSKYCRLLTIERRTDDREIATRMLTKDNTPSISGSISPNLMTPPIQMSSKKADKFQPKQRRYAPSGQRLIKVGSVKGSAMAKIIAHIKSLEGGQFCASSLAEAGFEQQQASECLSRLNAQGMLIFERWIDPPSGGRSMAVYTWYGQG